MITGNMATFPARKNTLERAVHNIAQQVNTLNLCLNEYTEVPAWLDAYANVHAIIPQNDLKDLGKFMFDVGDQDDVFLLDDDLDYPDDYVQKTLQYRDRYGLQDHVVGYHGTIYRHPGIGDRIRTLLYRRTLAKPKPGQCKDLHAYHAKLERPRIVAQLGTGTVLTRGSLLAPLSYMLGADRRADVRFARWCLERGVAQVALPRMTGWIPNAENDEASIWKTYTSQLPPDFVNEIDEFAFTIPSLGQYLDARS